MTILTNDYNSIHEVYLKYIGKDNIIFYSKLYYFLHLVIINKTEFYLFFRYTRIWSI